MSNGRQQALGAPPQDLPGIHRWLLRLQEVVETGLGQRGDGKSSFVKKHDLVDLGLANWLRNTLVSNVAATTKKLVRKKAIEGSGTTTTSSSSAGSAWVENVTPGKVSVLQAVGNAASLSDVVLTWNPDGIGFYEGVSVYRASLDNVSMAVKVGKTAGGQRIFIDRGVDSSSPQYYWVRARSFTNSTEGAFNQTSGTKAVFDNTARDSLLAQAALVNIRRLFGLDPDDASMDADLIVALHSTGI